MANINIEKALQKTMEKTKEYIDRNRTHWIEEAKESISQSLDVMAYNSYHNILNDYLIEGDTYIVDFNGKQYTCIARNDGWGNIYIGNQLIMIEANEWEFPEEIISDEPFFMHTANFDDANSNEALFIEDGTFQVFHVTGEEIVHKLDKKFLPNGTDATILKVDTEELDFIKYYETGLTDYNGESSVTKSDLALIVDNNIGTVIFEGYENYPYKVVGAYRGFNRNEKVILELAMSDSSDDCYTIHRLVYGYSDDMGVCFLKSYYGDLVNSGGGGDLSSYAPIDNPNFTTAISMGRRNGTTVGSSSVALGLSVEASGSNSHAEGVATTASAYGSHSEGFNTIASGLYSHVEGYMTTASGKYQHVQGVRNIEDTENKYAYIVGNGSEFADEPSNAYTLDWNGNAWFAGNVTIGADNKELATKEYVDDVVKEASNIDLNDLELTNSLTIGTRDNETGGCSLSIGDYNEASGWSSVAIGEYASSTGTYSFALGYNSISEGMSSFSVGEETKAYGDGSHAEGRCTTARGDYSHAEGYWTSANGDNSHSEGIYTKANGEAQHVQGKYNIEDTANTYAHIVGNGTSSIRSNAHTLDWDGNAWFAGNVTVDGTPTADNDLVTKKYVDDAVANLSELKMNIVNGLTFANAYINYNNGDYISGGSAYACQEYIPVISGATYEVSGVSNIVRIAYYDSSKTYMNQYIDNTPTFSLTPPSNASYIRVHVDSNSNAWQNLSIESEIENYIRAYINNATSGGSGNVDLSLYALKTDLHSHSNKTVIDTITSDMTTKWNQSIPFNDTYVSDCNAWLTNGYIKTSTYETSNLPSACTGADKWGILFFIAENAEQGTGTQMYFPIDGTYKGRIFTRSLTNMKNSPNAGQWNLVSISNANASSLANEPTMPTISDVSASTNEGYLNGLLSKMEALEEKIKTLEEKIRILEEGE